MTLGKQGRFMAVDFTEKAKRYQAIDEIIASGRKLRWNQIISELRDKYDIKTSRTSFFRENIQYLIYAATGSQPDLYIIEANPRSSRTVPYLSKVTGIPMVEHS